MLCMPWYVFGMFWYDLVWSGTFLYFDMCWYVLVCFGMCWYVLVCFGMVLEWCWYGFGMVFDLV